MTKTTNYQLNQWESTDKLSRTDFNADNAAIDAAIKAVADTANSKAGTAEISALQQSVNSQIAALSTALGSGGSNCRIAWGSYTGVGKYGKSNPNTLNFDFYPALIFVGSVNCATGTAWPSPFLHGVAISHAESGTEKLTVTWTDTGLSWYASEDNSNYPGYYQDNVSGWTYYYCAIGYDVT